MDTPGENQMNEARKFLETTEDIFSSLDGFIDSLLNEYSHSEREQLYLTSRILNLSDETVLNYRGLIQKITHGCSLGLTTAEPNIGEFIDYTKNLISSNQSTIDQLAGLLENRSEFFFGEEMDELKDWVECYLSRGPRHN